MPNSTDKKGYGWSGRRSIVLAVALKVPSLKATFSPNPVISSQTSFPFHSLHLTLGICPIPCEPSYGFPALPHHPQLQVAGNSSPTTGVYQRLLSSPHSALWLRVQWHMCVRIARTHVQTRMHTHTCKHAPTRAQDMNTSTCVHAYTHAHTWI